jgi:hypothetical protein
MSDLRDPEPPQRVIELDGLGGTRFEFEIAAWPYSTLRNEKVISRSLVYRLRCENFRDAIAMAKLAEATVQAVHDVWIAKIVRVGEVGG